MGQISFANYGCGVVHGHGCGLEVVGLPTDSQWGEWWGEWPAASKCATLNLSSQPGLAFHTKSPTKPFFKIGPPWNQWSKSLFPLHQSLKFKQTQN